MSISLFTACPDEQEPPQRDTTISLQAEKTGITTITLKVSVEDTTDSWTFGLSRNDSLVLINSTTFSETIVTDAGLTPTTEYHYQAYWMKNGTAVDSSAEVTVITGDTTSHNFVWTIDTLGAYGSSLRDVAIVDENNVWMVGELSIPDSADYVPDYANYNAARWDGSEWKMIKIMPQGYVQPLRCIFYFNENDIWFGQSTLPIRWNGKEYYLYTPAKDNYPGGSIINSIWALSQKNIYFAGSGGCVHYDGSEFTRMESGTEIDLKRISGAGEHVFATGFNDQGKSIALELVDGTWVTLFSSNSYYGDPANGDYGFITSVDVFGDTAYIAAKTGLLKYAYSTKELTIVPASVAQLDFHDFMSTVVQAPNDILLFGVLGNIRHFNGMSWKSDNRFEYELDDVVWRSGAFSGNTAYMVGIKTSTWQAVIAKGVRY